MEQRAAALLATHVLAMSASELACPALATGAALLVYYYQVRTQDFKIRSLVLFFVFLDKLVGVSRGICSHEIWHASLFH